MSLSTMSTSKEIDEKWFPLPTPIMQISGLLALSATADLPSSFGVEDSKGTEQLEKPPCLIITSKPGSGHRPYGDAECLQIPHVLEIESLRGKKGEIHFVNTILPKSVEFIKFHLYSGRTVCIACDSGKDLSVGIAVAALQMFFDNDGKLIKQNDIGNVEGKSSESEEADDYLIDVTWL